MALNPEEKRASVAGFTMPEGTDLIMNGDDAIRKNAVNTMHILEGPLGPPVTSDVMYATDARIPKWIDNDDWSHALTDRDGYTAAGVDKRGTFATMKQPFFPPESIPPTALGTGLGGLDSTTGWAAALVDKNGRLAWGLRNDGREFSANPLPTTPSRTALVCIGDSLVRGYTGGTAWNLADAFPAHMEQHLPGVEVANYGFGGNTTDELAVRIPAVDLYVSVDSGTLPAGRTAEPITVHRKVSIGPAGTFTQFGAINGIFGNLTYSDGSWTFTRQTAGDPVPVPGKVIYEVSRDNYSHATALIWCGRNDINSQDMGAHADMVSHVVNGFDTLVSYQGASRDHFLIVGPMNQSHETAGTERYNQVIEINKALAARYPGQYIDVRSWFVHEALAELGIEPTAEDTAAMNNDAPPPSLTDGGSHYIKPIAPLLAAKFATALKERGYL